MADRSAAARRVAPLLLAGWLALGGCPATGSAVDAAKPPEAAKAVAAASGTAAVRFRFGMKDQEPVDWSGKVDVSGGRVASIRGWRWMPGDHADGAAFIVQTCRQQARSEADRARVAAGQRMGMQDNGIVVHLSAAGPDAALTFDAKPGKVTVKPSDLPYGTRSAKLDGNRVVERVPPVAPLAETMADEDYPSAAVGKDGTIYLAYLAFTRGKDFQGARERPATAESGPVTGPLATGVVRKIEKPEDLTTSRSRPAASNCFSAPAATASGASRWP